MSVDFKKLLPVSLRNNRWGQFVQAYQTIWDDLIDEKINPILKQFDIEQATTDEIKNIFRIFGFTLSSYQGFCSTDEYYRREALSVALRIIAKTTRNSYLYTYFIYNLSGDVFPLYLDLSDGLIPIDDWWENNEFVNALDQLDAGDDNILYYVGSIPVFDDPRITGFSNTTLDSTDFKTLDMQTNVEALTRYILISFEHLFVEDEDNFLTEYTIKGLISDINQIKKATEIAFYEPTLNVFYKNVVDEIKETEYTDYDQTLTTSQNTILFDTDFLDNCNVIRFGIGAHTTLDNSITDVQNFSFEIAYSDFINSSPSGSIYNSIRKKFNYPQKLSYFTEFAMLDSGSNCLFYSTFPAIKFPENMNSNIQLTFKEFFDYYIVEIYSEDCQEYTTLYDVLDNSAIFDQKSFWTPDMNYNGYYIALGTGGGSPPLPTDTGLTSEVIRKEVTITTQITGQYIFEITLTPEEHNYINFNEIALFTEDNLIILKKNITINIESYYNNVTFQIISNF